uniref:Spermidine/spermine N1-acetyltransferase family member 2b n=1 Tax=Poecilia reticulata TaxID=8081 RepID=A0A3P9QHB2_POERE
MNFRVRPSTKEDCKDISRMIMELAVYEKMPDQVEISHKELERDGFCQNPFFECLVAEVPEEHKSKEGFTVVGYALYFYTYSTWRGRSVYLEDLYVMPEFRGTKCVLLNITFLYRLKCIVLVTVFVMSLYVFEILLLQEMALARVYCAKLLRWGERRSVCGCSCRCSTGTRHQETSTLPKELRISQSVKAGTSFALMDRTSTI